MTIYLKRLYRVRKAVFSSSPAFILILLKAAIILNLVNTFATYSLASVSLIRGGAFLFLIVKAFRAR